MSHPRRRDDDLSPDRLPHSPPPSTTKTAPVLDSSTVPGRVARFEYSFLPSAPSSPSLPPAPSPLSPSRHRWKVPPSPLHTRPVLSPTPSASPRTAQFSPRSPGGDLYGRTRYSSAPNPSNSARPTAVPANGHTVDLGETSFFEDTPSPPISPVSEHSEPIASSDDIPRPPSPTISTKPSSAASPGRAPAMAGTSANAEGVNGAPRNSSIDSALSAISGRNGSQSGASEGAAGSTEITALVSAAGSPEAVIQYLLKEKQANAQQNAQLWRLVDKQRAMILGLNKDLERALKDKEKYRKKLKEVIVASESQPAKSEDPQLRPIVIPRIDVNATRELVESPKSVHSFDEPDSAKESPVDMALAPYPITPPADKIPNNGPPSAVGELLDPRSAMPKASEHALDNFDHEAEDSTAAAAKKAAGVGREIPYNATLPPSRSLPSAPPTMPPPKPPGQVPSLSIIEGTPILGPGSPTFPPPPTAPPPRKPPPAPLQLKKDKLSPTLPPEVENDSESDYDSLLEVDELPVPEKRGRRRTREEDDRMRELIAIEEAQARSASGKNKSGTPTTSESDISPKTMPAPVRIAALQPATARENASASLASVLNGDDDVRQTTLNAPVMNAGLPASPRPMGGPKSPTGSAPLSPRGMPPAPLSPRPPRQNIPLPPNTPLSAASSTDVQRGTPLRADAPMQSIIEAPHPSPPAGGPSPTARTKIYSGFKTEEYPDLLLPPNALPSIEVKVASSRMKPPRASMISLTQLEEDPVFTLAIYSRAEGGELWRVEKDTASFGRLDVRMKQCPAFTARTPDRSLFTGHAPAKLDARRMMLESYLGELLETPLDSTTALEFCKYLSTNALPPNTDDMGTMIGAAAEESGTQLKGPGGRPFKTGYLTKRGKNFGGWKARFFVLEGPQLRYFETPGGAHLGTIKLYKAQIGKQSQHNNDTGSANGEDSDNQYRHAFLVLEPKKKDSSSHVKHVLCAESDVERDQWVETLLHWIDYVEPGKDDASSVQSAELPPRRGSGGQVQKGNAQVNKKRAASGKGHAPRGGSQDGLIGMSYDSAKVGSVPDGAPARPRGAATPDIVQAPLSATFSISGPRDMQPIPDGTMWSGKSALAIPGPTYEEKKQRKRSFFGFGPKTRSSTDDQDSLYGSSAPSMNQAEARGPVRQVFGAQLADAVRYCGPLDANVPLPCVVYRCIQYLDAKNAILEEGIFRLSGSNVVIKQLRERFNTEGDINLVTDETYYDIHAIASLLKLYLRELPTTILTRDLHMQFISVSEMTDHKEKISALAELSQRLPQANATLLKYLIAFLIKVINHADHNKMTVRNVGIVFSPTLNIPAPIFALLLGNYEAVFGIEPEAYELPSPDASDAGSRSTFEAPPRRPSTGNGPVAESPHRQRLLEQIQQHRSSPTPPPMVNGSLRATATPPPRLSSYEPFYPGLVGSKDQAHGNSRSGFDHTGGVHGNTLYESEYDDEPADQGFNGRAKRRESAMFLSGPGLSAQGSKSRLREETRM